MKEGKEKAQFSFTEEFQIIYVYIPLSRMCNNHCLLEHGLVLVQSVQFSCSVVSDSATP